MAGWLDGRAERTKTLSGEIVALGTPRVLQLSLPMLPRVLLSIFKG